MFRHVFLDLFRRSGLNPKHGPKKIALRALEGELALPQNRNPVAQGLNLGRIVAAEKQRDLLPCGKFRRNSQISRFPGMSSSLVGSSRSRTSGWREKTRQSSSRFLSPAENPPIGRFACAASSKRPSHSFSSALASPSEPPSSLEKKRRYSIGVQNGRASSVPSPITPIIERTLSASLWTSNPPTVAVPLVGWRTVESIFTVVVLPAPFSPRNPYKESFGTSRFMS